MSDESRVRQLLEEALGPGGTPEEACAAFPELLVEVRERWLRCRSVEAQIEAVFPPSNAAPPAGGKLPTLREPELPRVPGYEVESVLGRGGIGVVYKARHLKLGRPVALKMLLAGPYASPLEQIRFLGEAAAVAALRHPNIVQVYDVGDLDGRPYFTMEFVEGGTLAGQLGGAPLASDRAASLAHTLAGAVHAAHLAGIVHRDLKPANVLLTEDGTPKVSDFGLARRMGRDAALTLAGARVGTPSYMAPEQARGDAGAVGPSADVYSLGAILYEMLAGRPPFQSGSAAETERRVIAEEPAPPARSNPRVPRDLQTICLKCLHKDPQRRYATAAALAEDLRRFLQGEPIAARPARFPERAAKWARRHPGEAVSLVGGVLLAFVVLGVGLWVGLQRAETARAVREDLRQVGEFQRASDWPRARTALERANARLAGGGPAALRRRLRQAGADLDLVARLATVLQNRAAVVAGHFNVRFNDAHADGEYAAAFRDAGLGGVDDAPEAVAARVRASGIPGPLVAALDDWAACAADERRQAWLLSVARLADHDPTGLRDRLRDPAEWKDRAALAELARIAPAARPSVQMLVALGERWEESGGDAVPYLKQVQQEHPGDFQANFALGEALRKQHSADAIRYFQAAVAVRPAAAVAWNNLGIALSEQGRGDEAMGQFRQALRIDGAYAPAHNNLGIALKAARQIDEAIEHFRAALRAEPDDADTHNNLGLALAGKGSPGEAMAEYREALRLNPDDGPAHNNLGILLRDAGRTDEAIGHFREALRVSPDDGPAHNNLGIAYGGHSDAAIEQFEQAIRVNPADAPAHNNLGIALKAKGRLDEAIEHYRRALQVEPDDPATRNNLGLALAAEGRQGDAIIEYRRALQLKPNDAPTHTNLGFALRAVGQLDEAVGEFRAALEIDPADAGARANLDTTLKEKDRRDRAAGPHTRPATVPG